MDKNSAKSRERKQKKWRKFKKKYAWVWQLFLALLAVAICALVIYNAITNAQDKTEEVEDVPVFWEYDEDGRPYIDDYTYITFYERADENSPVIERRYMPENAPEYSYTYVYDDVGRLVRRNRFDAEGLLTGFSAYLYDQNGVNYRTDSYVDDEFEGYFLNTYDAAGKKTEVARYDTDETLIERFVYEYDASGDPTLVTQYSADGTVLGTRDYSLEIDKE